MKFGWKRWPKRRPPTGYESPLDGIARSFSLSVFGLAMGLLAERALPNKFWSGGAFLIYMFAIIGSRSATVKSKSRTRPSSLSLVNFIAAAVPFLAWEWVAYGGMDGIYMAIAFAYFFGLAWVALRWYALLVWPTAEWTDGPFWSNKSKGLAWGSWICAGFIPVATLGALSAVRFNYLGGAGLSDVLSNIEFGAIFCLVLPPWDAIRDKDLKGPYPILAVIPFFVLPFSSRTEWAPVFAAALVAAVGFAVALKIRTEPRLQPLAHEG